jgi:3-dehydroquinate synthase
VSPHETVHVALGARSYDVLVGEGLLAAAGDHIAPVMQLDRTIIVTDANVAALHLETLQHSLTGAGIASDAIVLPPGDGTKNFTQLQELVDTLLSRGIERASTLIALGGGMIGDLAGFAAAICLRGIDYIQIPTTLLAQVDSSVGGKTAINAAQGKNLIGAFHQPRLVLADIGILDTLPRRELLAGYAEVVKYGLIDDPDFFAWLEENGPALHDGDRAVRRKAVIKSCQSKANIVSADEREAGQRALLNLGHTFGHALEAQAGYSDILLHGEGVAIGMAMAFDLSVRMGLCPAQDATRIRRHFATVGLPTELGAVQGTTWDPAQLLAHMGRDKKVRDGQMTFILARGIGQAFVCRDVATPDILATLGDFVPS